MAAPLSHAARRPRNPIIEGWFSLEETDDIGIRRLFFEADKPIPIGRASQNPAKGIMPAENNLYIDSPVVSRTHAELRARLDPNGPSLYLTDKNSMHGTHVDGVNLKTGVPTRLGSSARVRLGNDVVRDDGTFIAPTLKVSFLRNHPRQSASPPPASFPRGITVPDATPSESEAEDNDLGASEGSDDDISIDTSEDDEPEYGDGYIVTTDDEEAGEASHIEETLVGLDHSETKQPEQQPELSRPLLPTISNMLSGTPPTSSNQGGEEEVAPSVDGRGTSPLPLSGVSDTDEDEVYVTDSEAEHSDEDSVADNLPCDSLDPTTAEGKQAKGEANTRNPDCTSSKTMAPPFGMYKSQADLRSHSATLVDLPGNTTIARTWPSGVRDAAFPLETPCLQHFMDPLPTDFYSPYQDHIIWNSPDLTAATSVALSTRWDSFPSPPMTTPDKPMLEAAAQSGYLAPSNSPPPSPPTAARNKTLSISELVDTPEKPAQVSSAVKRKAEALDLDTSKTSAHPSCGLKRKADAMEVGVSSEMQSFELAVAHKSDGVASPTETSVPVVNSAFQAMPLLQDSPGVAAPPEDQQPPRKRIRRMLGFASTVAASFAVGAIAVVGGLTALPEHFFE